MDLNHPRILVVDDDPVVCTLVAESLSSFGYSVTSANSGSEASELFMVQNYPIVLCDILLPDTNGLELMGKIKEHHPDTFVILFTGHASVDLAKEAIRQGAIDFITKPFINTEILEAVRRAENEQRANFSDITYTEMKILHELTVTNRMTKETRNESLELFGVRTAESFSAGSLRIYLKSEITDTELDKVVEAGVGDFADEVTWYFLASRIMQSGGEALLEQPAGSMGESQENSGSFMGTVIPTDQDDLGVILVGRSSKQDRFKTRDLKMLGLYAAQLGSQLQNLRMNEELQQRNIELEKVNLVTSGFSSSLEIASSISAIARGLRDFIPFDVIGLFVSIDNGIPYNYILRDSTSPADRVFSSMRRHMGITIGEDETFDLMARVRSETFTRTDSWEIDEYRGNPVEFTITRLDEFGKINGWMVLGSRKGKASLQPTQFMPIILRHATSALCNSLQHRENQSNYLETITALAQTVDAKDKYTHFHSRNVTAYTLALADRLGITGEARNELWNAALLHDIGKIGIPESILNKPGKLTEEEAEIIRTHPAKGCSILKPIKAFKGLLPAIRHHHERYDGKGYPDGLERGLIPLAARVLTVADSFDAMTSNRIYRKSPGLEYALLQLEEFAGQQFDPELVAAFSEIIRSRPHQDILRAYGSNVVEDLPAFHS